MYTETGSGRTCPLLRECKASLRSHFGVLSAHVIGIARVKAIHP